MQATVQSWGYGVFPRIVLGFLALFMFGLAAFIVSLPLLVPNADQSGDWILTILALVLAGFGTFCTFATIAFVRTRIALDGSTLAATVPDHHNRFLAPHFREIRLPIAQIRSVERRTEIVKSLGMPMQRDSLSIVTSGGERIGLLTSNAGSIQTIPIDTVANAIAAAAGVAVSDGGTVYAKGSSLYGQASSTWTEKPLDEASATRARSAAARTLQICTAVIVAVFVLRACLHS